ncbi:YqgQ family protein [Solibacillus sp. FSL K6-1523]|uniref:YqgQ family protein n=1 Tax=Solibacillus sp. FSL K6-1523 TaxID=2921471 RepID=UPI0030F73F5A
MQSMLDIIELLKRYGIYIYTRDRIGDLYLMEDEIKELYKANFLDLKDYQMAMLILRQEERKIKEAKTNQL